ncbi:voltage-gated chloride channel family protein [Pedobacter sp. BAL39]|uniref:voltage-gated chloride channel family protein n=1 Tax=Pedobacter sp. BAL39 TaxID=391596 RepID=UPI001E5BC758|nr:voltage-gated chloride channel family protein [Pedobacter sp. BAL39]
MKYLVRWTLMLFPVSVAIGTVVALFMWLLSWATHFRFQHTWLLYLLPLSGILIHFIYQSVGKSSEKGNNLIIEEIHQPGGGVPIQMAPIVLMTTIVTHLFGGSAGREGTAVQIGGSIAGLFGRWFKLNEADTKVILTAGIAAGFGAVFGTPLTGAIFAIEVLTIGRMKYDALLPALIASFIGDLSVTLCGIHHTAYHIDPIITNSNFLSAYYPVNVVLIMKITFSAVCFGLSSYLFVFLIHQIKAFSIKMIRVQWLIPVFGAAVLILMTSLLGKPDYLGLGVESEYPGAVTIPAAFQIGGADTWSWLWKNIFTAVTLGTGFKGGEVTPLFYMGATLGNVLSVVLHAPVSLFAALGFIAVFSGATKTPFACTLMGAELFGIQYLLFFALACFIAYWCSGRPGIYSAQKTGVTKIKLGP